MNGEESVVNKIKEKAGKIGAASIVLGIIILLASLKGETQVRFLHGILAILVILSGIIIRTVRKSSGINEIGTKLIWGGWIMLPISGGGFLLVLSSYYSAGLGKAAWIILLSYLITICLGVYTIVYSNKETGTPLAP